MRTKMDEKITQEQISTKNPGVFQSAYAKLKTWFSGGEYSYLIYAFLVPVLLMYLIYLAMEVHPFGDGCVLVLDLNGQYVYFYEALRKFILGDNSLIYSFQRALGGEFMGIYAYYIASPFSYLVALFPEDRMLEALLTIFLLKSGLCGFNFGFYLHKNTSPGSRNKYAIVTFSILYAMSAYCVVQQHNSMWIDAVLWLPILTYAIEQLIKNGRYKLFVIILSLTLVSNFYIGYMVCIYVAVYFFFYYFMCNEKRNSKYVLNNPTGESSHFARSFSRICIYSLIAIGIAAVILLTAYYSLTFGKTNFSNPSWALAPKFELMDFFTKFLPGSYDTVRPEGLPFVYCGLLTVILVPVFFCSSRFSVREKVSYGILILFFFLSFYLSTADLIWHGFQKPNWLNYRYSFMLCFILLVIAYKAFGEIRKEGGKAAFAAGAVIIGFVILAQQFTFDSYVKNNGKLLTMEVILLSVIAAIAYMAILAVARKTNQKASICLILAIVCCLEVYCSGLTCDVQFGKDVVYSKYSSYNGFLSGIRPIVNAVQDSDHSFYRMEKTHIRKTNDEMALGMRGLSCSTSTLNKETIDFLRYMGYASKSNWSKYLGGNAVSDSLFGIKYLIAQNSSIIPPVYSEYGVDLDEESSYTAYLNPYALSLAFGVNSAVNSLEFDAMDNYSTPMARLNALVSAALGESETLQIFSAIPVEDSSTSNCTASASGIYTKYVPSDPEKDATLTYTVTVPEDKGENVELFFYLACDKYYREVSIRVNGLSKSTSFGGNETARIVSLGTYPAGSEVNIAMTIKNDSKNLYIKRNTDCVYYIDYEVFEDAFGRLKNNPQYIIDNDCKDDHLTGTVTTTSVTQTMLTTIPYDEGWTILVDGLQVEYEKTMNALISFDISGIGTHTVEMIYRPSQLVIGIMISCASIAIFLLICIFEKKLRVLVWGNTHVDPDSPDMHATEWQFSFGEPDDKVAPPPENELPPPEGASEKDSAEITETSAPSTEESEPIAEDVSSKDSSENTETGSPSTEDSEPIAEDVSSEDFIGNAETGTPSIEESESIAEDASSEDSTENADTGSPSTEESEPIAEDNSRGETNESAEKLINTGVATPEPVMAEQQARDFVIYDLYEQKAEKKDEMTALNGQKKREAEAKAPVMKRSVAIAIAAGAVALSAAVTVAVRKALKK